MQEFTVTIKTFCGCGSEPGTIDVDYSAIRDILERHAGRLRDADREYIGGDITIDFRERAGIYWIASDKLHVTIDAPSGSVARAIAEDFEREGVVYIDYDAGGRGRWIYYVSVGGCSRIGKGAGFVDAIHEVFPNATIDGEVF